MKTKAEKFTKAEKELIQLGTGMMHIIQVTDPKELVVLKTVSTDVRPDEELIKLLSERMLLSMNDPANPGIGIAAPQLGINRNVVWVTRFDKDDEPAELYLNPKITWYSDFLRKGKEGCLSIPDIQDNVLRSYAIKISYMDVSGNEKEEMIEGFTAVVFQHEIDHLNGILFTDRLLEQANLELIPANDEMELFLKKSAKKRR
ncbi:peptide deformylase [Flavobacterium sp. '19STA2R22 D10 B1']|uniref:peptide deformylase n=1 Tax=Flavobacterium aerium TaxID=3037261 RepID=UPI00278BC895|nr:peptide deformylase [Flavobacterium sp. '19STA2R22 D10 B1']